MMSDRREVLKQLSLGAGSACLANATPGFARRFRSDNRASMIKAFVRRDDTILRLGGLGLGYHMSWGASDSQYLGVNDGAGWTEKPRTLYNSQLWTISGSVQNPIFSNVSSYPDLSEVSRAGDVPRYVGCGLLAVRGRIYQFLGTLDRARERPRHWVGSKLIYSSDGGRSWHNQDGTSPVVWEDWDQQSRGRFAFFQEADGCFSLLSILQMGRNYGANRDGYIYVYGVNGNTDGRMNELVMFRVAIDKMLDRGGYEFFGGFGRDGSARWTKDIDARAVVHSFPRGWVNGTKLIPGDLVVESWVPSVVYNEPLGLYMMASAGIGCAPDGTEFGKPSYLGFWVSATPWGPWRQVHEETAWTPGGDPEARAYLPRISSKWISQNGTSFWFSWSDIKGIRALARDEGQFTRALEKAHTAEERSQVSLDTVRRYMPGLSFNLQRVDIS